MCLTPLNSLTPKCFFFPIICNTRDSGGVVGSRMCPKYEAVIQYLLTEYQRGDRLWPRVCCSIARILSGKISKLF